MSVLFLCLSHCVSFLLCVVRIVLVFWCFGVFGVFGVLVFSCSCILAFLRSCVLVFLFSCFLVVLVLFLVVVLVLVLVSPPVLLDTVTAAPDPLGLVRSEGTVPLGHALGQWCVGTQGPECIFARILSQEGPVVLLTRLHSSSIYCSERTRPESRYDEQGHILHRWSCISSCREAACCVCEVPIKDISFCVLDINATKACDQVTYELVEKRRTPKGVPRDIIAAWPREWSQMKSPICLSAETTSTLSRGRPLLQNTQIFEACMDV